MMIKGFVFKLNRLFHFSYTGPATGNCNFESGTCHWSNSAVSDMPWYLREGKTGSVNTGPSVDHTTGTTSGTVYSLIETCC